MKVSTTQPFQIVYSLFQHQYLGYLFDSFVVQRNSKGELTYQHQNISSQNAHEFNKGLDDTDYELIKLIDAIQQETIVKKFYSKKIKTTDFFLKIYDPEKGDKNLQATISSYIKTRQAKILSLLDGKMVFEMGRDGEPTWKQLEIAKEAATVLFHFRRNDENTHYFPTIKYQGQKLEFQYKNGIIVCDEPAWLLLDKTLHHFANGVDGKKIKPFLNKKFIVIPKKVEDTYYHKFVAPLVASFDVYAKGFEIASKNYEAQPVLTFSEYYTDAASKDLFGNEAKDQARDYKILFELNFQYDRFRFKSDQLQEVNVEIEKEEDSYTFFRIKRKTNFENKVIKLLKEQGLVLKNGHVLLGKEAAFSWINEHTRLLERYGFDIQQNTRNTKKYFLGKAEIQVQIKENKDWFDIYATVKFGEFDIPFFQLRKLILQKKTEFTLPNGEIAIIPEAWLEQYADLLNFSEAHNEKNVHLKKHHLSLIQDLKSGNHAQVTLNRKLEQFRDFEEIAHAPMPDRFNGSLRPYQQAGYDWLNFLNEYRFGGCLADDMGLGKTIQALALLQSQKEKGSTQASLLIIPTSLIYNWQLEAKKFVPELKIFVYTGSNRKKNVEQFHDYDLVVTSYGITRIDIKILKEYQFNYVILDESQAIKNPTAAITKAVQQLRSKNRLILTGTPLENTTLDLWSQISFINPGLLGTQAFFKKEYLLPIEKKHDVEKLTKLKSVIKPFILRRLKGQVATELPEKIENVQFCTMTDEQEQAYEKVKSQYRNEILKQIESRGMAKTQFLLLQGLTKLRQLANHPRMIDQDYEDSSGKMEDILYKLESIIGNGHKVLVFSQFVKHLQLLKTAFEERQWCYAYLDGSTKNRQEQVENFQNKKEIQLFLISLKAGGVGLNLTAAEYVFLLDPWWNPAIEAQAIDRAHRIGQKNTVFTYKFITKGTVEEKILALQTSKKQLAQDLITTEESFIKSLTKEDVMNLLD
ncbi:helicase SNF2 [marine bacterium AO1-C]|nr:helicase SNF2 [marine bacterium AO1-C]